jgi:cytolysin-activating lysine-acyltransferase
LISKPTFQPLGTGKTVAQVLGETIWLLTQSPMHRHLFVGDLDWFLMPPIWYQQARIFFAPTSNDSPPSPVACALWGYLSQETAKRFEGGEYRIAPHEWRTEGGEPWLVELISPFGADEREIIRDLAAGPFAGHEFKLRSVDANGQVIIVRSVDYLRS